jgi:hypothetical protein
LTIGYFRLVAYRSLSFERPVDERLLELVKRHRDSAETGFTAEVTAEWVRCPWWLGGRRIATTERIAREALRMGCVVADVEHHRLIGEADLAPEAPDSI